MVKGKLDIPVEKVLEGIGVTEVRYKHFGNPLKQTTCLVLREDGSFVHGFSWCSQKDSFSRREGRKWALRKALHALDIKNRRNNGKTAK